LSSRNSALLGGRRASLSDLPHDFEKLALGTFNLVPARSIEPATIAMSVLSVMRSVGTP
jgi:hypothetical protein